MNVQTYIEQSGRKFEEGCNAENISDPPADKEWLKAFLHSQLLGLLEVVRESLPKQMEKTKEEADSEWFLAHAYNMAINDILSLLTPKGGEEK